MKITQTSKTEWKDTDKDIVFEFPNLPGMAPEEAKRVIDNYIKQEIETCLKRRIYSAKHHTILVTVIPPSGGQ